MARTFTRSPAGLVVVTVLAGVSLSCVRPVGTLEVPEVKRTKSVYVVRHGWHAGIVMRNRDIPSLSWPEHSDFGFEYVEVGWGDRDFYQAPRGTSGLALKAAFWPSSSVLHIAGFDERPEWFFPESEIVEMKLSIRDFDRLCTFIHAAYARDATGRTIPLGPGKYPNSRFYEAVEKYSLLKTCNQWIARALRSAGCPTTPASAITAGSVMRQAVERCGATAVR